MPHAIRLLARGWLTHTRYLGSSGFFVLTSLLQPLVFASIACLLFRNGERPDVLPYAVAGAGLLSIWTLTLVGSGQALTLLRTAGLLELLVAAPAPFGLVLAPITLATASFGVYSLAATLLWGRLLFDVPISVAHPLLLVAAIPASVFGLGMLGMVFAAIFVRFRYANAFTNVFDYPVWLLSGVLVPLSALPGWCVPVSWLLPTTWAVLGVRGSLLGDGSLAATAMCLLTGLGYLGLALLAIRKFETLARRDAALALT